MSDLHQAMRDAAQQAFPNEACGLVVAVGDAKKPTLFVCRNISEEPRTTFLIEPKDYAAASDLGEIVGVFHSHVNQFPVPSDADLAGCESTQLPWHLISITQTPEGFAFSEPHTFTPSGYEAPYIGRVYVYGIFDCFELTRDFYRREFGIQLAHVPRRDRFWHHGEDVIGQHWKALGFHKLAEGEELHYGDVVVMHTEGAFASHLAIYVGDGEILHHATGRLSRKTLYGGFWLKHTVGRYRHVSKC